MHIHIHVHKHTHTYIPYFSSHLFLTPPQQQQQQDAGHTCGDDRRKHLIYGIATYDIPAEEFMCSAHSSAGNGSGSGGSGMNTAGAATVELSTVM